MLAQTLSIFIEGSRHGVEGDVMVVAAIDED